MNNKTSLTGPSIRKNLRRAGVAAFLGLASLLPLSATTLGANQNQFTLTIPDYWNVVPSTGTVTVAQNGDAEALSLMTGPLDDAGPLTADSPYIRAFVSLANEKGISVVRDSSAVVNGVPYYVLILEQPQDGKVLDSMVYFAVSGGQVYQIAFTVLNSDPTENIDYAAIINSFSIQS